MKRNLEMTPITDSIMWIEKLKGQDGN